MQAAVLSEPTLVLNRAWLAIATTSVRHAIRLMYGLVPGALGFLDGFHHLGRGVALFNPPQDFVASAFQPQVDDLEFFLLKERQLVIALFENVTTGRIDSHATEERKRSIQCVEDWLSMHVVGSGHEQNIRLMSGENVVPHGVAVTGFRGAIARRVHRASGLADELGG